jgi:hypothetical protein
MANNIITMKKQIEYLMARMAFLLFVLFNATVSFAQDGGTGEGATEGGSVTVSKSTTSSSSSMSETWYTEPWVWIVGALVFILLLVALTRGGRSSRDVHRTTTVKRDVSTD